MPLKLTHLTDESVTMIFLHLAAHEVHICQLVCKRFDNIVRSSLSLQFMVELGLSGYIESRNPRTDISLKEKCDTLRLHRLRRWNRSVSSIKTILTGTKNGGFNSRYLPSGGHGGPLLTDGIITHWSLISRNAHTDLQLDVVQLPSLNTGTELSQWRLTQKGLNIRGYSVEPACDLLVLLEYTGPLIDPFELVLPGPPLQLPDTTGFGGGIAQPYLFHFRTLSTNESHPSAFQPILDCGLRTKTADGFSIRCFGDLVTARPDCARTPGGLKYGLLIYNWVTGALLDRRDELYPEGLLVLTNELIVIPQSTFTYSSEDSPMGIIELYRIDWSDSFSPTLSCVIILELPIVHSVPFPVLPRGTRIPAASQAQDALAGVISVDPSLPIMTCICHFAPGFQSGQPAAYATGASRIFASAQSSQILWVQIIPSSTYYEPSSGAVAGQPPDAWETSFYVPLHVFLDAVKFPRNEELPRRIQWDQWGSQTRWLHPADEYCENPGPTGTRCVLTQYHASPHERTLAPDLRTNFGVDLLLLDFSPMFLRQVERNANRGDHSEHEGESGGWIYQPATTDHMSPVAPRVAHGRWRWLGESGADKAVAPYAWSRFKHEYLDNMFRQSSSGRVMMDDEHIVVVEGETWSSGMVTSFTF